MNKIINILVVSVLLLLASGCQSDLKHADTNANAKKSAVLEHRYIFTTEKYVAQAELFSVFLKLNVVKFDVLSKNKYRIFSYDPESVVLGVIKNHYNGIDIHPEVAGDDFKGGVKGPLFDDEL